MNLAVKLFLTNPAQTTLLCQYVLKQAKYDQNYDIRDRSRFLNNILFPPEQFKDNVLSKHANNIFLAEKPAPLLQSNFVGNLSFLTKFIKLTQKLGFHLLIQNLQNFDKVRL